MQPLDQYGHDERVYYATDTDGNRLEVGVNSWHLIGFDDVAAAITGKGADALVDVYVHDQVLGLAVRTATGWEHFPLLDKADELAAFWLPDARDRLFRDKPLPADYSHFTPDQIRQEATEFRIRQREIEDQLAELSANWKELCAACQHPNTAPKRDSCDPDRTICLDCGATF